jgi:sec-independent protein translocase protein TatB
MFDIGFFELLLLAIVGLLVLGPQRLPQAVRTVGLYIGRIRKAVSGIQQEVNEQLQLEEMRQRLSEHEKKVKSGILDAEKELEKDMQEKDSPHSKQEDKSS